MVDVNKKRSQDEQIHIVPPQKIIQPTQSMIDNQLDDIDIMIEDQNQKDLELYKLTQPTQLTTHHEYQDQFAPNPWEMDNQFNDLRQSYKKKFSANDLFMNNSNQPDPSYPSQYKRNEHSPSITDIERASREKSL